MLKEISVLNTIEENKEIFNSIKVGERFYIVFKNIIIENYGLWKGLFIKTNENIDDESSFLHKDDALSCTGIPCSVCAHSKRAGFKLIKIKNK